MEVFSLHTPTKRISSSLKYTFAQIRALDALPNLYLSVCNASLDMSYGNTSAIKLAALLFHIQFITKL